MAGYMTEKQPCIPRQQVPVLLGSGTTASKDASLDQTRVQMAECAKGLGDDLGAMALLGHEFKIRPQSAASRRPTAPSSRNLQEQQREAAKQCVENGNFLQAWELFNEIGDRNEARKVLEDLRGSQPDTMPHCVRPSTAPATSNVLAGGYAAAGQRLHQLPIASELRRPSTSESSRKDLNIIGVDVEDLAACWRRALAVNRRKQNLVSDIFFDGPVDGNRFFSRKDLFEILKKKRPITTEDDSKIIFDAVDIDRDGLISYEDFIKWLIPQ
eukprot:TRINITY_DN11574_c2_g1_i1.p1 TRINITY_DN11574_c2_g1~~TRINITY_DN11574_c2_g1_i1.p1  ORF type:complete len:270 (-),score=63.55 TRINITY_DN11574_c2_g1_i1:113-922(-)